MTFRKWIGPVTALLVVFGGSLAACSSGGSGEDAASGDSTASSTTEQVDQTEVAAYAEEGPYEVGSTELSLADGRRVVVWYPAADSASELPADRIDIAGFLNETLQAKIPADKRPIYEIDAHAGAEPSGEGPFPVVLFSHGYAGFPEQSADLVTHLASWGFVVVAPDHVERSLSGLLGGAAVGVPTLSDTEVLGAALDVALAASEDPESPLYGLLDPEHVAVTGHSAGASAAYEMAAVDDRIDGFISYSVGLGDEDASEREPPAVPEVPGMVMAGSADGVIPIEASQEVFEGMQSPKYWVEIDNAGHLVFSDVCLIGRDEGGLVGLVEEVGLDIPENLLVLAKDGCEPGDLDPTKAFDAIDHLSVAFLRSVFGIDEEPVGLDPAVTENFTEADVTLEVG